MGSLGDSNTFIVFTSNYSFNVRSSIWYEVAPRYKAWVCGRLLAGTAGSDPDGAMDICLL
jgi:hypothetical protein